MIIYQSAFNAVQVIMLQVFDSYDMISEGRPESIHCTLFMCCMLMWIETSHIRLSEQLFVCFGGG